MSYSLKRSPIGPYFQLNSPNNFSANRSVVDSNPGGGGGGGGTPINFG